MTESLLRKNKKIYSFQMADQSFKIGTIYSWQQVSEIHKSRNGIYQRHGELVSLLTDFGKINPCYPDFTGETAHEIFYTGAGRRGDQKLDIWNKAMHTAIKTSNPVPLFCKLGVNQWKFMGYWKVFDVEYIFEEQNQRNVWSYLLKRVDLQEFSSTDVL